MFWKYQAVDIALAIHRYIWYMRPIVKGVALVANRVNILVALPNTMIIQILVPPELKISTYGPVYIYYLWVVL